MPTKRTSMQKKAIRKRKVKSAHRKAAKKKRRAVAKLSRGMRGVSPGNVAPA